MQNQNIINVAGVGPNGEITQKALLEKCDIIVGGERVLKFFEHIECEKIFIKKNLDNLLSSLKNIKNKNILFLTSGDPFFFGIGKKLIETFGTENITVYPYFNSLQLLASKAKINYEDCINFSIHGRKIDKIKLINIVKNNHKVSVLTDKINNINKIADILSVHFKELKFILGQMLYTKEENIIFCDIEQLKNIAPSDLDILLIINKNYNNKMLLANDENKFFHEKGLITKKEIRAISLSYLELNEDSIVWDIGAGSGSISVEASFLAPLGQIFAIEKNEKRIKHIKKNIKRFNCHNIETVIGEAPDILNGLPAPDRIFIGGNFGGIKPILNKLTNLFEKNLIVVINIVSIEKINDIISFCKDNNLYFHATSVNIGNLKKIGTDSHYFKANNIVYIFKIKNFKTFA